MEFDDPDFPTQVAATFGPDGIDILPAWERYSGAGVRIGVVDTGIQWDRPELYGQVDPDAGWSAETNSRDSYAGPREETHGTLVALVLAARADNGIGGVGAAWGATLVSYEIAWKDAPTREEQFDVLNRQWRVDISNNCWGVLPYSDNFLGEAWREGRAVARAATEGRDGLGTVIVRSAGNNAEQGDDANARSYANNRFTMTVGAADEDGRLQEFSTHGSVIWVAATAKATSYAAPLVSATAALMLEANPDLGYRDVQAIIALSARPAAGPTGPVTTNAAAGFLDGGGIETSRGAGFGLLDASAAVRLAEAWEGPARTEANVARAGAEGTGFPVPIRGAAAEAVTIAGDILVERAVLTLHLTHPMLSTLRVWLVSPSGTESLLLDVMGGGRFATPGGPDIDVQYTSTQFFWERSPGSWVLRVEDTAPLDQGTVRGWRLDLYGAPDRPGDTYFYTDAFAGRAAGDEARRVLADTDGGIDGLNAAAVSGASVIDLAPGGSASRIDGAALEIAAGTVVEKAWGGGGDDSIAGNAQDNTLAGGWGGDRLDGLGGADRIEGGEGADTLLGGNLGDTLLGDADADSLAGGNGADSLRGGAGEDTLLGGPGYDTLAGGSDSDAFLLDGASGMTDTITDLVPGRDRIWLRAGGFDGALAPGTLPDGLLTIGPKAEGGAAQLLYDAVRGTLLWDADGVGPAEAVRLAVLETRPALEAADFLVVA